MILADRQLRDVRSRPYRCPQPLPVVRRAAPRIWPWMRRPLSSRPGYEGGGRAPRGTGPIRTSSPGGRRTRRDCALARRAIRGGQSRSIPRPGVDVGGPLGMAPPAMRHSPNPGNRLLASVEHGATSPGSAAGGGTAPDQAKGRGGRARPRPTDDRARRGAGAGVIEPLRRLRELRD